MTIFSSPDSDAKCLPQMLDLPQANGLRDDLIQLLAQGAVVLDAAAVERMSTPSVQVLLAAGRAADAAGSELQIVNASEAFRAAIDDLGLRAEFKNWVM
ncbi:MULTISPECIES: STAS domain-containing protein [Rhodopseudomonas]|uniref:STAS domain-containing protein n=1 Tax=Rhodopseudomonas TaxID=1073 RepID=UPI001F1AAB20|nr:MULTISPECIES: STAS domain-containing protein [Rhodopseudomonas]MDF3809596.1 STAS domain-containing protein [Rhodopseudomonas sp. BAL398]WOK17791.1 STAS domain-containing protein [Rhodopseudomonas sp. BAL398]